MRYTDYDGELAYPGEIHQAVVQKIAQRLKLIPEQTIDYADGSWGRADLVSEKGYIWEVKPDSSRQIRRGGKQLDKYLSGKWRGQEEIELHRGYEIPSGSFMHRSADGTRYHVEYRYAGNGVIAYQYGKEPEWEIDSKYLGLALGGAFIGTTIYLMSGSPHVEYKCYQDDFSLLSMIIR